MHDVFFVPIASINFCGCACVTLIALQRRLQWRRDQPLDAALPRQTVAPQPLQAVDPTVAVVAHSLEHHMHHVLPPDDEGDSLCKRCMAC